LPTGSFAVCAQLRVLEHGYRIGVARVGEGGPSVDVPEDVRLVEQAIAELEVAGALGFPFLPPGYV
jgi:hypothetical protein